MSSSKHMKRCKYCHTALVYKGLCCILNHARQSHALAMLVLYCMCFFKDGHEHVHIQYQACICTVNKFCKGPDVFWVAYLPRHSCLAAPGFGCSVMLQQLDWTVPRDVFGWVAGGNKKTKNIEKKMQSGFLFKQDSDIGAYLEIFWVWMWTFILHMYFSPGEFWKKIILVFDFCKVQCWKTSIELTAGEPPEPLMFAFGQWPSAH